MIFETSISDVAHLVFYFDVYNVLEMQYQYVYIKGYKYFWWAVTSPESVIPVCIVQYRLWWTSINSCINAKPKICRLLFLPNIIRYTLVWYVIINLKLNLIKVDGIFDNKRPSKKKTYTFNHPSS